MTQLSDDCFAFGDALLNVDAALSEIEERVTAVVETAIRSASEGRALPLPLTASEVREFAT